MPCNYSNYPPDWQEIRKTILQRAGDQCEGSPAFPFCRAKNGEPHPVTGSKVVLTVAHFDHNPQNSDPANLRAWCQRCHLNYDSKRHAETRRLKRYDLH